MEDANITDISAITRKKVEIFVLWDAVVYKSITSGNGLAIDLMCSKGGFLPDLQYGSFAELGIKQKKKLITELLYCKSG